MHLDTLNLSMQCWYSYSKLYWSSLNYEYNPLVLSYMETAYCHLKVESELQIYNVLGNSIFIYQELLHHRKHYASRPENNLFLKHLSQSPNISWVNSTIIIWFQVFSISSPKFIWLSLKYSSWNLHFPALISIMKTENHQCFFIVYSYILRQPRPQSKQFTKSRNTWKLTEKEIISVYSFSWSLYS